MAFENQVFEWTFLAGADLTAAQFHAVAVNAGGRVVLAGAGGPAVGILQNAPRGGEAARVCVLGITKAVAGGAVSAGSRVAANANGQVVPATTAYTNTSDTGAAQDPLVGSNVIGIALTSATAAGQVISIVLTHMGAVPRSEL